MFARCFGLQAVDLLSSPTRAFGNSGISISQIEVTPGGGDAICRDVRTCAVRSACEDMDMDIYSQDIEKRLPEVVMVDRRLCHLLRVWPRISLEVKIFTGDV